MGIEDLPDLIWHIILADSGVQWKRPFYLLRNKDIVPLKTLGSVYSAKCHTLAIFHTILLHTYQGKGLIFSLIH